MRTKREHNNQLTFFDLVTSETSKTESAKKTSKNERNTTVAIAKPLIKGITDSRTDLIVNTAREEGLKVKGLVVHDNMHTLASVDKKRNLRLQEIFAKADLRTLRSLFRILGRRRQTGDDERVNRYIVDNPPHRSVDGIPRSLIKDCYGPFGRHYNLNEILKDIMDKYTEHVDGILITWRKQTFGRSSITWGSYRDLNNGGLIRINSLLDRDTVPKYVVESVVYHELLHHFVPAENDGKNNRIHTPEFKRRLGLFENYEKAEKWKVDYFKKTSRRIRN